MNHTELKALAEKATPGPWTLEQEMNTYIIRGAEQKHTSDEGYEYGFCDYVASTWGEATPINKAKGEYIAAANPAAIQELIAQLEDAQGEIRALLVNEQNLRAKADRWDFLADRMLAADFDYGGEGIQALVFEMPDGFSASADAADTVDRARALLEQQK